MNERGVTIEGVAELIGLSDRTIRRRRVPENETYSLNTVVAVCVPLHLTAYQCDIMIMLAGYRRQLNFLRYDTAIRCWQFVFELYSHVR